MTYQKVARLTIPTKFNFNIDKIINDLNEVGTINCFKLSVPDDYNNLVTSRNNYTSFLILTVNIRSINANFDDLLLFLTQFKHIIDIIVLTECWTNDKITIGCVKHRPI